MDILNQFGISPVLLAAQAVNFLVLLIILNTFLYRPILKVLKERQERIAKSLKEAEEIDQKFKQTELDREKILAEAAVEGQKIIVEATTVGQQIITDAKQNATSEMEKLLAGAQEQIRLERQKLQEDIRTELVTLVIIGVEKVVGKVLTQKDQKELVRKVLQDL